MASLAPVAFLFAVSVLLQLMVAGLLLRGKGWQRRFHTTAAAVLVLNAGIAALVAWGRAAGWPSGGESPFSDWIRSLDFASVVLLLALAVHWNTGVGGRWTQRDAFWVAPAAVAIILYTILILHGGTWLHTSVGSTWFLHVPTYLSYAGLMVAGTRNLIKVGEARVHAPLLVAFGMRGAQFAVAGIEHGVAGVLHPTGTVHAFVSDAMYIILFGAALFALGGSSVAAWRRPEDRQWCYATIQLLVAGGSIGYAAAQVTGQNPAYEAAQLISLVLVRPMGIGFSPLAHPFGRSLLGLGAGVGTTWLVRLLFAGVTRESAWALSFWWTPSLLIGAAAALSVYGLVAALPAMPQRDTQRITPATHEGRRTKEAYGTRLLEGLVQAYEEGRHGATLQDLLLRADIPRGSQTFAERGLARLLGIDMAEFRTAAGKGGVAGLIAVRNVNRGGRGRPPREYTLTEAGYNLARNVLQTNGRGSRAIDEQVS